jgi:quercetin dioxygenase-like cupin family protein
MRDSQSRRPALRYVESDSVEPTAVTSIEGTRTSGTFFVRPLLIGEGLCLLEVQVKRGVASQLHAHSHESLVHVVSGRLRTVIGERVVELGPGDSCRHSQGILHSVEALEDTVFLEAKAPVPNLQTLFDA